MGPLLNAERTEAAKERVTGSAEPKGEGRDAPRAPVERPQP